MKENLKQEENEENYEQMDKDEPEDAKKKSKFLSKKSALILISCISLLSLAIFLFFRYINPSSQKVETILDINPDTKFLVTLGSSHLGGYVLQYLLDKKVPPKNIITTVRNLEKGKKWQEKGIELRKADYTDRASLEKAFQGVDRIYFVSGVGTPEWSREVQHTNVIEAAKKNGVKLIVYSSFVNCQENTNFVADDHKLTEKLLEKSGLNYSIARNAIYLNSYGELFKYLAKKENNFFYNSCGDRKIALLTIRELGEAGACILLKKENKKIYELSGNPISFVDIKNTMEKMTGKEIKIIDVKLDEYEKKYLELKFGAIFSALGTYMHPDFKNGIFDVKSKDLEDLLGHPPATLEDNIKEVIDLPNYF